MEVPSEGIESKKQKGFRNEILLTEVKCILRYG